MISESSRRISACSKPTALLAASSERNELEHTSSARPSVRWASVIRAGRISCSTTRIPALATCQAASEPARPAPTIWTVSDDDLVPVMGTGVALFDAQWNAPWPTCVEYDNARSEAGVIRSSVRPLGELSRYRYRMQRAECPSDQGRYRPVRDR